MATRRITKRHIIAIFVLVAIMVVGIIAVLTALGFKAGQDAITDARKHSAIGVATNLNMAIESYHDEYNRLPDTTPPPPLSTDGRGFMDILLGLSITGNPGAIPFFHAAPKTSRGGLIYPAHSPPTGVQLHDPWGRPYFVQMDADHDGKITDPFDPSRIIFGRRAISWSTGPDGKHNLTTPDAPENADNVYSWK